MLFSPATLTFDLVYDPHLSICPRYCPSTPQFQILGLYIKRFGQESPNRWTGGQKDGTDSITSTADATGKNVTNMLVIWLTFDQPY